MKKIVVCLLILSVICALPIALTACRKPSLDLSGYTLVFSDEFDGELDRTIWRDTRQGYRRKGYWDSNLAFTDGEGHLILRTELRDEVVTDMDEASLSERNMKRVYSGAVRTLNTYMHGFGYYEIRCKLPTATGMWHAFWLMCGDVYSEENGSEDGVEIDVFEYLPARDAVNVALHWDGYTEAHKNAHDRWEKTGLGDGEYHIFGVNWDETGYTFYIDGEYKWTTTGDGICEQDGYMIISTEVGEWGTWVGDLHMEDLPVDWVIDYVKIYEKNPA